jgi:hypothetical protein
MPASAAAIRLSARPNPYGGAGRVAFVIDAPSDDLVELDLFDTTGRLVAEFPPERVTGGEPRALVWSPPALAAGHYLLRAQGGSGVATGARWTVLR